MLSIFLLLLVVGVALTAFLYIGTLFVQGYFYTEPGGELAWRAPAAAAALTLFYLVWCLLDVANKGRSKQDVPYDTLFSFNRWSEMTNEPVKNLWAIKKNTPAPIPYKLEKYVQAGRAYPIYKKLTTGDNWSDSGVVAIEIEYEGRKLRFERKPGHDGKYPEFVSDAGWVMDETEFGPTGIAKIARAGRLLANVLLNVFHLGLWFVCLWPLLRFQWAHALSLAAVLWLVASLAVLPPLLKQAAAAAWPEPSASGSAAGQDQPRPWRAAGLVPAVEQTRRGQAPPLAKEVGGSVARALFRSHAL